ncbi:TPA: helix-turn-helix transcriptional regulator [Citrobacter freundii]|nr:helix-turn-helix transcriptional regulator [Enterobacter hormaechei subsp. steigerwaltii]HDT0961869.1 helix-turn-helix transcriptional regulator [Enterobacter hormaechei subsp. steigerwaltii]HED2374809.1 helix-turn-helix transcriptional regulator [Citrobacter freundii]HED3839504.1 helix-turn-helix transcriptional regulator [Citrobacter freundii]HED3844739.1 helix-turn-helix transcriptional regulator [Citrobacter freundii]
MKTFSERLNAAMADAGISQGLLAERVGISQPAIQKMTSGKTNGSRKMVELAHALNVRPEWLSSGNGPMRSDGQQPIPAAPSSIAQDVFRVDVLDLTVSAGPGSFMISEFVEVLHAIEFTTEHARSLFGNRSQGDVKVMTVDGDSMNPTIQSGDRLFFDVSVRSFKVDGVYAFVFGQHFHVKRLQMQGLQLAVLSDNPAYKDWYVTEDNQDQLYIMGKALIHESIAYNKL